MPDAEDSDGVTVSIRRRLLRGLEVVWLLISRGIGGLGEHHGTQLAASMAYYALLSVFPAVIVIAAAAGFVLDDPGAREDVVEFLTRELPLSESSGRSDIDKLLDGVATNAGTLGAFGLVALLIAASALIGAVRNSLSAIFEEVIRRGPIRGKALDVLIVVVLGVLLTISFAATVVGQFQLDLSGGIGDWLQGVFESLGGTVITVATTTILFTLAFKILPAERHKLRDMWPGILFAIVSYELLKRGFSIYLDNFSNYSAIYGSLGAVIAFMVFIYLASLFFLLGAEMAAEWPGIRDDDGSDDGEGKTVGEEIRDFFKGLVSRNPVDP